MKSIKTYNVVKSTFCQGSSAKQQHDLVIVEEPLEVWIKHQASTKPATLLFTTMRTPGDDIHMVTGWLYSSGLIDNLSQVAAIHHIGTGRLKNQPTNQILITFNSAVNTQTYQRTQVINSACGVCGQQSIEGILEKLSERTLQHQRVNADTEVLDKMALFGLVNQLQQHQPFFIQTGGNHGSALFTQHMDIVDVREDVGRHNALDKLIGANIKLLEQSSLGVVLSGRVSFELVQKAVMANIRYIVAIGAPSSLAIDLALDCDVCLVGFVKSSGFNCYAGAELLG